MRQRKRRRFRKRNPPIGSGPGALVINGQAAEPVIRVVEYGPDHFSEHDIADADSLRHHLRPGRNLWVDVQGLGNEHTLQAIGKTFSIHPLALADVVNVPQRPKVEPYDENIFIVTRTIIPEAAGRVHTEQVSLLVGRDHLITFQEKSNNLLDPVRQRLRQGAGSIRSAGPDYLAYAVWDTIVDGYYPILESFGEYLEQIEEQAVARAVPALVREIHETRHELLEIRRAIWPQRDAINSLIRDPSPFISNDARVYLRDCYDHCIQIVEVLETYREVAGGLMDIYLSSVGNRQNEVMKVLTVVATIFIPLTFIVGVYGMNFANMPELGWRWAYPVLWVVMIAVAAGMLFYFRRKGWIGAKSRRSQLHSEAGQENHVVNPGASRIGPR